MVKILIAFFTALKQLPEFRTSNPEYPLNIHIREIAVTNERFTDFVKNCSNIIISYILVFNCKKYYIKQLLDTFRKLLFSISILFRLIFLDFIRKLTDVKIRSSFSINLFIKNYFRPFIVCTTIEITVIDIQFSV